MENYQDKLFKYNKCSETCKNENISKEIKNLLNKYKNKYSDIPLSNVSKNKTFNDYKNCTYPKCKSELIDWMKTIVPFHEKQLIEFESMIKKQKILVKNLKKNLKNPETLKDSELEEIVLQLLYLFPYETIKQRYSK